MYFDQGKGSCLKADRCTFLTILISQCMSLRVRVKENAKDQVLLGLPPPLGEVGEIPHEDVTPLEVVRHLAGAVGEDQ